MMRAGIMDEDFEKWLGELAHMMWVEGAEAVARAEWKPCELALSLLARSDSLISGGLVCQRGRRWEQVVWHGQAMDEDANWVLAEAMDRGELVGRGNWKAIVLGPGSGTLECALVGQGFQVGRGSRKPLTSTQISALGSLLTEAWVCQSEIELGRRRARRHETLLKIAAQWSAERDSAALLESIARAATELVGAERASIFLWDRRRQILVGRPALGVSGNVLEVSDSAGIVGAVLRERVPKRWHADGDAEGDVNRTVDRKLNFQTRSLLAVPLWSSGARRGEPIGVFEVINRVNGIFDDEDELTLSELALQAAAAIESTQTKEALAENCERLVDTVAQASRVVGIDASMVQVRETAERVANTDLSVLLLGENGTGKEVLARTIHYQSQRKQHPFVAVNCAALVESLLESELFGHEKGAFTDAHQTRQGKFELAHRGTIFLDEVGDLSPAGQAKLLRVLEERLVTRVGGATPIPVDVRVIAATNQPLREMVLQHRFREDLYFRLNVVTIDLPPLRARGNDVVLLAEHFLRQFSDQVGRRQLRLTEGARDQLKQHAWPGNIRELRNLIERVTYLTRGDVIDVGDLGLNPLAHPGQEGGAVVVSHHPLDEHPLADATRLFQQHHIEQAIIRCDGNMTEAADQLGLHRSNLYRKMRQLGLEHRIDDKGT